MEILKQLARRTEKGFDLYRELWGAAAEGGHIDMLRQLAALTGTKEGSAVAIGAVNSGRVDIVEAVIAEREALGVGEEDLALALVQAMREQSTAMVNLLDVDKTKIIGGTVLHGAAASGKPDVFDYWLERVPNGLHEMMTLLLPHAVRGGNLDIIRRLIPWAAISSQALTMAMRERHYDILRYLLQQVVTKGDKNLGLPTFIEAIERNDEQALQILREHGVGGSGTLAAAARSGRERLQEVAADLDDVDADEFVRALTDACVWGRVGAATYILQLPGADANGSIFAATPLYQAAKCGNIQVVDMLLQQPGILVNGATAAPGAGARIQHQPAQQMRPIVAAAGEGHIDHATAAPASRHRVGG